MPLESIRVASVVPASPSRIYDAWLSSNEHSAFTGGAATIEPHVGGKHTAWDGYIWGTVLDLEPSRRIVTAWRTSDFAAEHADSRVEVLLAEVPGGTEVTVVHSNIPEGQGKQYEDGWAEFYFVPMSRYFGKGGTLGKAQQRPLAKAAPKPRGKAKPTRARPPKKRAASRLRTKPSAKTSAKPRKSSAKRGSVAVRKSKRAKKGK